MKTLFSLIFIISFWIIYINKSYYQIIIDSVDCGAVSTKSVTINYDSVGQCYMITNVDELRALSKYVMNGNNCANMTFKLMEDIVFSKIDTIYSDNIW